MCIRVNSLLRGHSAIRLSVLESMVKFLNLGITPLVPLRTSISASGDLSPLAYIAASLCGHPDLRVIDRSSGEPVIKSAVQALEENQMEKVRLLPKEGLALINGTGESCLYFVSSFAHLMFSLLCCCWIAGYVRHSSFGSFVSSSHCFDDGSYGRHERQLRCLHS